MWLSMFINFWPHIKHCHTMSSLNILFHIVPQGSLPLLSVQYPFFERCLHPGSTFVCHFALCTFIFFLELNSLAHRSHLEPDPSLFSLIMSFPHLLLILSLWWVLLLLLHSLYVSCHTCWCHSGRFQDFLLFLFLLHTSTNCPIEQKMHFLRHLST